MFIILDYRCLLLDAKVGCNCRGRSGGKRRGESELEYLRRHLYLTPRQLERRKQLEEEERRKNEEEGSK